MNLTAGQHSVYRYFVILVTACMASTGEQKGYVPPISGGQTGIVGAAAKMFCSPPVFQLFHPYDTAKSSALWVENDIQTNKQD